MSNLSEEEIEILQYIQYALDNVGSIDFGDFEVDDIQGLLDLYQTKTEQLETALNSLKKEKEKNKELYEDNQKQWEERCKLTFELENSISNDKIKAKIEEVDENGYWEFLEKRDEEKCKDILQSLLEKE